MLLKGRVRQQYTEHIGYVLQSATPYYAELTVRQNLILAAHMKLDSKMAWREKSQRVQEVLSVVSWTASVLKWAGLNSFAGKE